MKELKVDCVIISKQEDSENYLEFKEIISKNKIQVSLVERGYKLNIDADLYFNFLWPNSCNSIKENILNNNSIVCKFCYKNFSILFTGDIEEIAEKQILEEYKNNLYVFNSNILKVAHHGSKTSSTQSFLEIVKPQIALIGVGKNNKFNHPNEDVLKRLKKFGCRIFRTDQDGEIMISVNKNGQIKLNKLINSN